MKLGDLRSKTQSFIEDRSGFTSLQAALAFSAIAITAAVLFTPNFDSKNERVAALNPTIEGFSVDRTFTGAVNGQQNRSGNAKTVARTKRYTIRRSVLQKKPSKPCVIFDGEAPTRDC